MGWPERLTAALVESPQTTTQPARRFQVSEAHVYRVLRNHPDRFTRDGDGRMPWRLVTADKPPPPPLAPMPTGFIDTPPLSASCDTHHGAEYTPEEAAFLRFLDAWKRRHKRRWVTPIEIVRMLGGIHKGAG
jgi:hypothetical protein